MRDVPGGVPDLEPTLRFTSFGDSSVQLRVILKGQEYADQYVLKHEFIKRLHQRYQAEGIEIPFPIRTLHFKREDAPTLAELAAPPTQASMPVERNGHVAES
jgi:small-conductance mechanosensitive channel